MIYSLKNIFYLKKINKIHYDLCYISIVLNFFLYENVKITFL